MHSPALAAALADIDTVFNGFASPDETGCEHCFRPEETAYLRTPYTRLPLDVLRRFVFKTPGHFEDHAAVVRRLLPQTAHALADGALEDVGWAVPGLARVAWRAWPPRQAEAVETFVHAWWQDVLTTSDPPYPVYDVFEICAGILATITPLLDLWRPGPVPDAHLAVCTDHWLHEYVRDEPPFLCWDGADEPAVVAQHQAWLAEHAPARLRAVGHPDLGRRAALLGRPYDERWAHPYWYGPSATS
ncbi:hypothetical protein ACF05L_25720 [Streptomyces bobili]|uniref:hypothetical protein n=1 Tax=Streptomyces bobili TaxID=67280 RepID=UPI0036F9EFE0